MHGQRKGGLIVGERKRLDTDVQLSFRQKIEYAVDDLGCNLIYFWANSYLLIFYTDVFGIRAIAVTTLMLVVRILTVSTTL